MRIKWVNMHKHLAQWLEKIINVINLLSDFKKGVTWLKKAINNFENNSLRQPAVNYQNNSCSSLLLSHPPSVPSFLPCLFPSFFPFCLSSFPFPSFFPSQKQSMYQYIVSRYYVQSYGFGVFFPFFFFFTYVSIPRKTLNRTQTHRESFFQVPHLLDLSGPLWTSLPCTLSLLCSGLNQPESGSRLLPVRPGPGRQLSPLPVPPQQRPAR